MLKLIDKKVVSLLRSDLLHILTYVRTYFQNWITGDDRALWPMPASVVIAGVRLVSVVFLGSREISSAADMPSLLTEKEEIHWKYVHRSSSYFKGERTSEINSEMQTLIIA